MKAIRLVIPALAVFGALTACGVQGTAVPAVSLIQTTTTTTSTTAPPTTKTVYVQPAPTHTVYVAPSMAAQDQWYGQQAWIDTQSPIDIPSHPGQTDCQWLHANGYSYPQAYAAWAQRGYPANWSATNDGYPCQRSYGMQH